MINSSIFVWITVIVRQCNCDLTCVDIKILKVLRTYFTCKTYIDIMKSAYSAKNQSIQIAEN